MRYYFITSILITLFISKNLLAQEKVDRGTEIQFLNISLEEALEKSVAEQKPIFLYAMMINGPCRYLEKGAFSDKELGEYYNEKFITVITKLNWSEENKFKDKYSITKTPTLLYINTDGSLIYTYPEGVPRTVENLFSIGKQIYGEELVENVEEPEANPEIKLPFKVVCFVGGGLDQTTLIEENTWVKIAERTNFDDNYNEYGQVHYYARYTNNQVQLKVQNSSTRPYTDKFTKVKFYSEWSTDDYTHNVGESKSAQISNLSTGDSKIFTYSIPSGAKVFKIG